MQISVDNNLNMWLVIAPPSHYHPAVLLLEFPSTGDEVTHDSHDSWHMETVLNWFWGCYYPCWPFIMMLFLLVILLIMFFPLCFLRIMIPFLSLMIVVILILPPPPC
jgi:hypothetical protein